MTTAYNFGVILGAWIRRFLIWGGLWFLMRSLVLWEFEPNPGDWGLVFRIWMVVVLIFSFLVALGERE